MDDGAGKMTIGERKRRLAASFDRAHGDIPVDDRRKVEVKVRADADNYFVVEEKKDAYKITVSDVFLDAPDDVQETLALMVLCKAYGIPHMPGMWKRIKEHLGSEECIVRSQQAFLRRSNTVMASPLGDNHDLRRSLKRVKERYFDPEGGLGFQDPVLAWSKRPTYKRFGYWMEDYNIIVVSRVLDSPKVPEKVVDFIVYHELLHKKHGHLNLAGHSEAHYHSFNVDEKRFEDHKIVENILAKIYKSKGEWTK